MGGQDRGGGGKDNQKWKGKSGGEKERREKEKREKTKERRTREEVLVSSKEEHVPDRLSRRKDITL